MKHLFRSVFVSVTCLALAVPRLARGEKPQPNILLILPASSSAGSHPHYFSRNQLFDLETDPSEKNNLFAMMPEQAARMKSLLTRALGEHIPDRPFGELHRSNDPGVFRDAASAVWLPHHRRQPATSDSRGGATSDDR